MIRSHCTISRLCRKRNGISLLEVTIGTMLAGVLSAMAASVAFNVSRSMANNIAETQIASEARMAVESLRRDLAGVSFDSTTGNKFQWRLVGRLIPNEQEMRLCFDADDDASADWVAPDRVIVYYLDGTNLVRDDLLSGNTYTVARHVSDVQFSADGTEITIALDMEFGGVVESYTFLCSDVL